MLNTLSHASLPSLTDCISIVISIFENVNPIIDHDAAFWVILDKPNVCLYFGNGSIYP